MDFGVGVSVLNEKSGAFSGGHGQIRESDEFQTSCALQLAASVD